MFGFTRNAGVQSPSDAVRRAIEADGLPPGIDDASSLRIFELHGTYSGRKVTFIRVVDPASAAERAVNPQAYADLDDHPELVLRMGHVERDGTVVITWRAPAADAATPRRELADRAAHADDERFVFQAKRD